MTYTYGATTYAKLNGVSSTYSAYQVRVGYELQSQSVENNESTYKETLEVRTVKDAYETYGFKQTTTLAGVALSAATFSVREVNKWVTFGTRTVTVKHDDYGDYKQTITGSFTTTASDTYSLKSGSATVEVKLPNIPRKTTPTLSKSSVTLGETITITLPRAADSFTHELYYKVGNSAKILIAADLGASYTYTVPLMFANWIENTTSGTVILYCQTYSGETYIGETSVNLTVAIPTNIVPKISNFTVAEAVSDVSSKVGVYLKGKSKLKVSFTATGDYAATITTTKITVGTQSYTGTSITTGVLSVTGTLRITVEATDTRGRQNSDYIDIDVYDYAKPYINVFSVARCDANGNLVDNGAYAKVTIDAGVTNVSKNTATYKVGYKLPTASSYTYVTLSNTTLSLDSSIKLSPTFNTAQSYDMILVVTDVFNASTNRKATLETEFVLLEYHNSGTGLAVGKVAEEGNLFDVNLPTEFRKGAKGVKILDGKSMTRFTSADFEATNDRVNSLEYLVATTEMTTGKPPWDAHILHMNWDNTNGYDAQLAIGHGTNLGVAVRGMEKGVWGDWALLALASQLSQYLPLTGGTLNGNLTLATLIASTLSISGAGSFGGNVTMSKDLTVNGLINGMEFDDTGWVDCTYASGFKTYEGYTQLQVRRVGKVVQLRGHATNTAAVTATTSAITIATIPEGFRPSTTISHMCQGSGYNGFVATVTANGTLGMARYGANGSVSAGAWLCLAGMMWLVE